MASSGCGDVSAVEKWAALNKIKVRAFLQPICSCYQHRMSRVTSQTSHVTRHTSHVTRHTSHVSRHTSHVTRLTSHSHLNPAQSTPPLALQTALNCMLAAKTILKSPPSPPSSSSPIPPLPPSSPTPPPSPSFLPRTSFPHITLVAATCDVQSWTAAARASLRSDSPTQSQQPPQR
jgi:hypothetical protein